MRKCVVLVIFVLLCSCVSAQTYFYAGSQALAVKDDVGVVSYLFQDRLGSDVSTKSLPFGQVIVSGDRFGFTGKERDEFGLHYFSARYYDSSIGRFTSVDPVPSEPSYQYVANNPLTFVDPSGRSKEYFDYVGSDFVGPLAPYQRQEYHITTLWNIVAVTKETYKYVDEVVEQVQKTNVENPVVRAALAMRILYKDFLEGYGYSRMDSSYEQEVENRISKREVTAFRVFYRLGSEGSSFMPVVNDPYYAPYSNGVPDLLDVFRKDGVCLEFSQMLDLVLKNIPGLSDEYNINLRIIGIDRYDDDTGKFRRIHHAVVELEHKKGVMGNIIFDQIRIYDRQTYQDPLGWSDEYTHINGEVVRKPSQQ